MSLEKLPPITKKEQKLLYGRQSDDEKPHSKGKRQGRRETYHLHEDLEQSQINHPGHFQSQINNKWMLVSLASLNKVQIQGRSCS